jgi:class 3 adenylate cyclase
VDRVAEGGVHAFGGEVLKFIGDSVQAIFPVTGLPAEACEAALRAVLAARAGMAHLDAVRQARELPPLPFGAVPGSPCRHCGPYPNCSAGSSPGLPQIGTRFAFPSRR